MPLVRGPEALVIEVVTPLPGNDSWAAKNEGMLVVVEPVTTQIDYGPSRNTNSSAGGDRVTRNDQAGPGARTDLNPAASCALWPPRHRA